MLKPEPADSAHSARRFASARSQSSREYTKYRSDCFATGMRGNTRSAANEVAAWAKATEMLVNGRLTWTWETVGCGMEVLLALLCQFDDCGSIPTARVRSCRAGSWRSP